LTKIEEEQAQSEQKADLYQQAAEELAHIQERIGPRFRRAEVRQRAGRFLEGLLSGVERKNGWQLAEELGEHGPRGVQRLLAEADWDEEVVRDDLRTYVVEQLGEESAVLAVDETGFVKKGKKSAGVARQYSGTAGRRENSQIGVFLLYAASRGAAFLDRALYLPEEWTTDRVRCREAGIADDVQFATKGELAKQMLARAFAAGVPAQWIVGDTVYGYEELRLWLDEQQKNYVLAVPETHLVWWLGNISPLAMSLPSCHQRPGPSSQLGKEAKANGCMSGPGCSCRSKARREAGERDGCWCAAISPIRANGPTIGQQALPARP